MSASTSPTQQSNDHFMPSNVYNVLKPVALIILPALGALYFALSQLWHLPKPEEVLGTVSAVDTFLGAVLGFASSSYNKSDAKYAGTLNVVTPPDGGDKILTTGLNVMPEDIQQMKEATFKVNPNL